MVPDPKLLQKYRLSPNLPRHVAVIMDGNGRWAKKHSLPRVAGHRHGAESVRAAVDFCGRLGIETLTLYAFSTENWRRPRMEVSLLMKLLTRYLRGEVENLRRNNVRLRAVGRLNDLPSECRTELQKAQKELEHCTGLQLVLALSYSGRADIIDAVRSIAADVKKGSLKPAAVDESLISSRLSTAGLPEVDLMIRTSGEMRLSNFLLWELAYSEFYVTKTLWPDFREKDMAAALRDFQSRNRRFGGVVNVKGAERTWLGFTKGGVGPLLKGSKR
jgi:undecaprenyl diphosphate synthase